jgi:hypothetical protein
MFRKTLTILSLLGLLLSVLAWVVSYLNIGHRGQKYTWGVSRGAAFWMHDEHAGMGFQPSYYVQGFRGMRSIVRTTWLPHALRHRGSVVHVAIPLWMSTLFFGSCFFPLFRSSRRRKHKRLDICVKCGHNLRGLTDHRCPECDTAFDERVLKKEA